MLLPAGATIILALVLLLNENSDDIIFNCRLCDICTRSHTNRQLILTRTLITKLRSTILNPNARCILVDDIFSSSLFAWMMDDGRMRELQSFPSPPTILDTQLLVFVHS